MPLNRSNPIQSLILTSAVTQGLTSSFNSTTSRSSRTKLVAQKLDKILLFEIALLYIVRNVARKVLLLI
jgi:hypothetical protein